MTQTTSTRDTAQTDASALVTSGADANDVGPGAAPDRTIPRTRAPRLVRALVGAVVPLLILLVWQIASTSGAFTPAQLPQPVHVLEAGISLWERGQLLPNIGISVQRVFLGFAIGGALGIAVGCLVGLSKWGALLLSPTLGGIRAVPSLAWVPLLILWLQIGENSKVTLVAIGAFFPVYTTVAVALRHVDAKLIELGHAFGYRGLRLLTSVQFPSIVPSIFSGLRLALAQAWLFIVAAELMASSMGLGFILINSQNTGRTDQIFLAILLLAIIGKLSDALLGVLERWAFRRWT